MTASAKIMGVGGGMMPICLGPRASGVAAAGEGG